jgi:hypothetical protein
VVLVVAFLGLAFLMLAGYAVYVLQMRPAAVTTVNVIPPKVDYSWNAVGKRIAEKSAVTLLTFGLGALSD